MVSESGGQNGDGKITWHEGEGGLKVAQKHMALMMDAEGL